MGLIRMVWNFHYLNTSESINTSPDHTAPFSRRIQPYDPPWLSYKCRMGMAFQGRASHCVFLSEEEAKTLDGPKDSMAAPEI